MILHHELLEKIKISLKPLLKHATPSTALRNIRKETEQTDGIVQDALSFEAATRPQQFDDANLFEDVFHC